MEFTLPSNEGKMRIVQELVPGKQVTLAHIIASPDAIVYKKLGLNPAMDYSKAAIGILSMSPAEISVIAGNANIIVSEKYITANKFVKTLVLDKDFTIDIKEKSVQMR